MKYKDVIIIGAGAAGYFTAINISELRSDSSVLLLERSAKVLQKVKVSGGGRCNVTHACFDPKELIQYYPRGSKELLGPFHQFACGDTFEWFENKNISLAIEEDGRVFPSSNTSQTIIDYFVQTAQKNKIEVRTKENVVGFTKKEDFWMVETQTDVYQCKSLVVASGSSSKVWDLLQTLGHTIVEPVPSLFTFNISDSRLKNIPGVVVQDVQIKVLDTDLESEGPLLVTHWGLSAPSVLKLSAYGARTLAAMNYQFTIQVNFIASDTATTHEFLKECKQKLAKKLVIKYPQFNLPRRLWQELIQASDIDVATKWADLTKLQIEALLLQLTEARFLVNGKSTFKEEFVTAGGVDLKEVNFKRFESKLHPNLFFAGEVLNIDAVTGGFNFQNAWTGGYIVAKAISDNL